MADARAEIAKLEALHAEHPQGRIFTHLAEAYRKAGELERAREVLAEGIGRHPDYSSAHVVLARVLMDLGEDEPAAAEFERVLELDGQNLVALRCLGDLARAAGRPDDAADYYRRLLDVEPSDDDVLRILEEMESDSAVDLPGLGGGDEPGEALPMLPDEPEEEAEREAGEEEEELPWATGSAAEELPGPDADEGEPWIRGDSDADEASYADDAWEAGGEPEREEEDGLPPLPPDTGEPGVMTETIAQVYARQGLYEQAAEVYRELVRNRPGDDMLRTRLEEMEALAAAPSPGTGEAGPGDAGALDDGADLPDYGDDRDEDRPDVAPLPGLETTEPDDAPDVAPLAGLESDEVDPGTGLRPVQAGAPGVEGVPEESVTDVPAPPEEEAPWDSGDVDATDELPDPWAAGAEEEASSAQEEASYADEEGPEAGAEHDAEYEAGYQREEEPLRAEPWVSAEAGAADRDADADADADAEDALEESEPWVPWAASEAAEEEAPGSGEPWGAAEREEVDAGAAPSPGPQDAEGDEAEQVESVWTGADGASGTEESPYAWAEGEPEGAADESPPIGSYLRSLLDWSGGAPAGGVPSDAPHGEAAGETAGEAAGEAAGGARGGAAAPDVPGGEAEEAGGDDDLDTFRSWLESLKQ